MIRPLLLAAVWGAGAGFVASADDQKPPYQRLLTKDDKQKVSKLDAKIAKAEAADEYAEAIKLQEEVLAIREQAQGSRPHSRPKRGRTGSAWPSASKLKALDHSQKVLGEEHPKTALIYWRCADNLHRQGKYIEATGHLQRQRSCLGAPKVATATAYI